MPKEFVMRGRTATGGTETLNFGGNKPGMAFKMTEFSLYPHIPNTSYEISGTVTAGKTAISPLDIDFRNEALIATAFISDHTAEENPVGTFNVINDTFLITQNLILMVETSVGSSPINWQCRFVEEKVSSTEKAVANYKQFTISDGS